MWKDQLNLSLRYGIVDLYRDLKIRGSKSRLKIEKCLARLKGWLSQLEFGSDIYPLAAACLPLILENKDPVFVS